MKLLIITELQVQDLIDTLKSETIRTQDVLRCLSNLNTLPEFKQQEAKPTNVKMQKKDVSKN